MAKTHRCPPKLGICTPQGSSHRLAGQHPHATPPPQMWGWRGSFKATNSERWEMLLGCRKEGPEPPRPQTEELFVIPGGAVVYLQPELFTSATGPDLHHGDKCAGPRPRLHPHIPRCCRGRRGWMGVCESPGEGLRRGLILLHTQQPSCPAARSSSPPAPGAAEPLALLASLKSGWTPSPKGHPCQPE